ncbi:hypothetical protein M422DRAFT_783091 [Sphaerobolus stellatus SS14]|uniref:Unplaced genomic scaffold SPHSTscaffold_133, whole genome shotgun sequence n=1 Tax=Sphaerobolus stellatus (strain SS14) TaxID=990650 RepID=A0A0C9UWZ1_SPHS4|nr:hypothetical protein M422DRAFT_783091 [Sphaerobolus stellatus SS14]
MCDPSPGYFFEWKWQKDMKENGIDQHVEVLNGMKEWVAEYIQLGKDQKDVLLKAMKTDIDSLIMKGTEIVSKLKEKGNLNGGRDGWGVAPFVGEERSQVVKFVQDLGGEVLMHMKKLADNMQTGGNVDLKLYFDLLKYLEAAMKNHVVQLKEKVVQLRRTQKSYPHLDMLTKLQKYLGIFLAYVDHSFGNGSVEGRLLEEWKKFLDGEEWKIEYVREFLSGSILICSEGD